MFLRTQGELLALDAELAEQFAQGRAFHAGWHEVRHGVQADVVFPAGEAVKAVQPARRVVPLEDADPLAEMGQSDAGGETGHARTDDDDVVVGVFHFRFPNLPEEL